MEIARIAVEARLPDGNVIRFRPFAGGDAEMVKDVYFHKHYHPLDLKAGDVVLDVGAHIGSFSIKASRLVGREELVVAVEPEIENYRMLAENIRINGLGNVVPLLMALSDIPGQAKLYLAAGTVAHSLSFPKSSSLVAQAMKQASWR